VVHHVHALHGPAAGLGIGKVRVQELDLALEMREIPDVTGGEVVHYANSVSVVHEPMGNV
jgi:hypothetical protein